MVAGTPGKAGTNRGWDEWSGWSSWSWRKPRDWRDQHESWDNSRERRLRIRSLEQDLLADRISSVLRKKGSGGWERVNKWLEQKENGSSDTPTQVPLSSQQPTLQQGPQTQGQVPQPMHFPMHAPIQQQIPMGATLQQQIPTQQQIPCSSFQLLPHCSSISPWLHRCSIQPPAWQGQHSKAFVLQLHHLQGQCPIKVLKKSLHGRSAKQHCQSHQ